jgi:hypothetical protein
MIDRSNGRKAHVDTAVLWVIAATLTFWGLVAVLVMRLT